MKRSNAAWAVIAVTLAAAACEGGTRSDSVPITVSSPGGGYWKQGEARVLARAGSPDLTIVEDALHQEIDGFGGAFNEQGWDALGVLDETERQRALGLLFGSSDGARFRFGRVPIGASDYALERYTLDDVPGDYALASFSIERDRRLLIPYVRAALGQQPALWLWASAWTPPPWMKTNNAYDSGAMRALERAPAGTLLIAVAGPSVRVADLARAASEGAGAGGRVVAWPLAEARQKLGAYADALALDQQASSRRAEELLGWKPFRVGILDDLRQGSYAGTRV